MKTKILRSLSLICTLLLLIPALSITAFAANTVTPIANYVTVTDSLSNGSLSNGTVTITAKGGQFFGQTNNITIQNISSSKCKITFDYTANHYGSFSEGSAEGTVTTILDGGGKYAMSITGVKALFADPATLTLRNFTCVEIYEGPITVTHNTLGTVTVNGTTVPNGGTSATITAEGAELIATPVNGASFVAWVNTNNNEVLSHKANFTLIPYATTMNISAIFTTADQAPYCKIGNTLYADLEDAINVAVSGNQKTVAIISNSTLPTGTITIPNGVSLLLPYAGENTEIMSSTTIVEGGWKSTFEHANTTLISGHTHGNDAIANVLLPNKEVTYTLTIPADTTLNVESGGKFVIGGTITSGHQSTAGILCATAGAHSNVIVDGTINVNGILSTCGYVLGAGTINVPTEGTIYQPFTFMNHQAGTYVVASSDSESYWPFTRYAMLNIQCDIHMEPGSNMKGYADIYTSKTSVTKMSLTVEVAERHNVDCVNIIGSSGSMINTSGTVDISYDPNRYVNDTEHNAVGLYNRIGTTTLDISGGASLGNFALTVSVASMEQTFDTANNYFPIPYNYVFNLRNGDYAIDYKIKLMPGAKMYVASDANLSVNGGLAIMDGFRDHASSTETIGLGDWYAFHYPSAAVLQASPLNSNGTANLIVDGNLTVTGTLVGLIQTNGTGTVSMNGNNTLDLHVGAKNTTNLMGLLDTTITGKSVHSLTAQLFNPNGERFTMENGKTYVAANAETHVIPEFSYKVYTTYNDDSKIESNTIALNAETIGSWACKEGTHSNAAAVRENEQPASCTADGSYDSVVYCTACHTEISRTTETIPLLSHKWTDATCTAPKTCSVCGETEGEALGHEWADADCDTPKTCSVCGATEGEALGHKWTDANCTAPKTCSVCEVTEGEALGHKYTESVTKAATCTENGVKTFTCSCGDSYTEEIKALGHDEVTHGAKAPSCTEIGWDAYVTCSRCDYTTYVEKVALGHDEVTHEAKAPTCTEIGWDAYVTCSRCDYTTYAEKAALSHDEISHEAKAPTCTEIGWDAYVTCSRCDYTTYVEKVALGHTEAEAVVENEVPASCYAEGSYDEVVYCSVAECKHEISRTPKTIEKTAHTPAEAVIENKKDATCGEAGSYDSVVYCSVEGCGKELSRENKNIDATGKHTGGEATCKTKASCEVCGEPYGKLNAENHEGETEVRNAREATCGEAGYTGDTYCLGCGEQIATGEEIVATGEHKDEEPADGKCDLCNADVVVYSVTDNLESLSLDGMVRMRQFWGFPGLTKEQLEASNPYMIVTSYTSSGIETYSVSLKCSGTYDGNPECNGFTDGIPASRLVENITMQAFVTVDGITYASEVKTCNILPYCERQFAKSATEKNEKLKTTLVALLNYGAEAQKALGHNTSNLLNANLDAYAQEYNLNANYLELNWNDAYISALNQINTEMTVNFNSTETLTDNDNSLSLDGAIAVRYYYGIGHNNQAFTNSVATMYFWTSEQYKKLLVSGTPLTKDNVSYCVTDSALSKYDDTYGYEYTFFSEQVAAADLGNTLYSAMCVTDSNGFEHCSGIKVYSPETYAAKKLNDARLANAMKWMVVYGERAKAYFGK